ncbi:MAG: mro 2, partial [Steroidobacteraceae bacterium]|nr:mro 2 [Steroidobacteraceae bacterium]
MSCSVERVGVESFDGESVERYRLRAGAASLECLSVGCVITRLDVPDRDGKSANVVLGYLDPREYAGRRREYFGAVVGRVANRIARGSFVLDGRMHRLAANDGANHLHGGRRGFDRRVWQVVPASSGDEASVRLQLTSPDGDEGYPGELAATVVYTLTADHALRIDYAATTTAPTVVNLTQHSYFNLAGDGTGDVLEHQIEIAADEICAVDETLLPTGELRAVAGTTFDLRAPRVIGRALESRDDQLELAGGFDHCFALQGWRARGRALRHACTLSEPRSGRRLRVDTDQPGMQFYSGNFLDGTATGPGGGNY